MKEWSIQASFPTITSIVLFVFIGFSFLFYLFRAFAQWYSLRVFSFRSGFSVHIFVLSTRLILLHFTMCYCGAVFFLFLFLAVRFTHQLFVKTVFLILPVIFNLWYLVFFEQEDKWINIVKTGIIWRLSFSFPIIDGYQDSTLRNYQIH